MGAFKISKLWMDISWNLFTVLLLFSLDSWSSFRLLPYFLLAQGLQTHCFFNLRYSKVCISFPFYYHVSTLFSFFRTLSFNLDLSAFCFWNPAAFLWEIVMDCSLQGCSVPGILGTRILDCMVAVPISRGSLTQVSCLWQNSLPSEPPGSL